MSEYDTIGAAYCDHVRTRAERPYVLEPSFWHHVGRVEGLEVLDLACGDGYVTEGFCSRGARRIMGVDKSLVQVNQAHGRAARSRLPIEYVQADACNLPDLGTFDLVTAAFLLHYAKTEAELQAMCQGIVRSLKPNGRFVTLNSNPDNPTSEHMRYWVTIRAVEQPLKPGGKLEVCLFEPGGNLATRFINYHWPKAVYQEALTQAGFRHVTWHSLIASDAAQSHFAAGYWDEYLRDSNPTILVCTRS